MSDGSRFPLTARVIALVALGACTSCHETFRMIVR